MTVRYLTGAVLTLPRVEDGQLSPKPGYWIKDIMKKYWGYENDHARPHHVTVHLAECHYCNDGKGRKRTPFSKGEWNGIALDSANPRKKRAAERRVKPLRRVLNFVAPAIFG